MRIKFLLLKNHYLKPPPACQVLYQPTDFLSLYLSQKSNYRKDPWTFYFVFYPATSYCKIKLLYRDFRVIAPKMFIPLADQNTGIIFNYFPNLFPLFCCESIGIDFLKGV